MYENANVEQLESARRRMLLGFLDGYVAWQVPQFITAVWGDVLPQWAHWVLVAATLLGAWGFLFYGWQIVRLQQRAEEDPALGEALNDERVRQTRHHALVFGFWSVIIYLAGVCLADLVHPLQHTGAWSQLGLVVAASSAIMAFLWLDRETTA